MLCRLDDLVGYQLRATDGDIGRIKDFLFDESSWIIRYLVADTGKWFEKRKVLISPIFLDEPDWEHKRLPVDLTRKTIEASPPLDEHAPISRQKEVEFYRHYQIPPYWVGPHTWGFYPTLEEVRSARESGSQTGGTSRQSDDASRVVLRAVEEVKSYYVAARNDEIGHIEDFLADTGEWAIRWLVVETRNWLPGRKLLVPPSRVASIQWNEQKLHVALTREQIENCPDFDPSEPMSEEYKRKLNEYYDGLDSRSEGGNR